MNSTPRFSIITVVFNAKNALKETILSIHSQSCKNFEHIIIDGGSSDGTLEYIRSLEYDNTQYISEQDNGIYDAMNKGIKLASGSYFMFLNAADKFASENTLEIVLQTIEKKKPHIIYGGCNVYSENGDFLSHLKPFNLNKKNLNRYATRVVCHQAMFVHKNIVKLYSDKYRLRAELNWYYDLLENTNHEKIIKINDTICNYYLGGASDKNFLQNFLEYIKVIKHHNSLLNFILAMPFLIIPLVFRVRRFFFSR